MTDKSNAYTIVIADLKRQRDEIDGTITRLEAMAAGKPVLANQAVQPLPDTGDQGQPEPAGEVGDNPYLGMSIVDATKSLLKAKRQPLSPAEILRNLEAGGMHLSGDNKANTIGSVLSRRQRQKGDIVSPKRGQWGLKEWYPGRTFGKKNLERENTSETSEPEQPSEQHENVVRHSFD